MLLTSDEQFDLKNWHIVKDKMGENVVGRRV